MKVLIECITGLKQIKEKELSQPFIKSLSLRPDNAFPNLYVTIDIFQRPFPDPLISLRTLLGKKESPESSTYEWNEEVELPIDPSQLHSTIELGFTVWDLFGPRNIVPIYYTKVQLNDTGIIWNGELQQLTLTEIVKEQPSSTPDGQCMYSSSQCSFSPMGMSMSVFDDDYSCSLRESTADPRGLAAGDSYQEYPTLFCKFLRDPSDMSGYTINKNASNSDSNIDPAESIHAMLCNCEQPMEQLYNLDDVSIPSEKDMEVIQGVMSHLYFEEIKTADKRIMHTFGPYLRRDPNALLYFLHSVNWEDPADCMYAKELMMTWNPPPLTNMILLLSKTYGNQYVYEYAIKRLDEEADIEFLSTYMLQFIWALGNKDDTGTNRLNIATSMLKEFVFKKAAESPVLGWLFKVYTDVLVTNTTFLEVGREFEKRPNGCKTEIDKIVRLSEWLVEEAAKIKKTKADKKPCEEAMEMLRNDIEDRKFKEILDSNPRLPVDPIYIIKKIETEKTKVFNSNNRPIKLSFKCVKEGDPMNKEVNYPIVYKVGDDMTQDVLALQAMSIMDSLLKQNGLDMRMCLYKALATKGKRQDNGPAGIMECVKESNPVKEVDTNKDIRMNDCVYMETLMHSYIGSSLLTYILGVGDRHQDNILLTKDGNYLHIDFGFILGTQPTNKGWSAEMRTIKSILDKIKDYAPSKNLRDEFYKVYRILRKNANLIIGLFKIREDTGLFKLDDEEKDIREPVEFLKKRLAFGKADEDATKQMDDVINSSENSFFDVLCDAFHK